jgi:hypothetical protein
LCNFALDDSGNQEARNDKEDVHANETTAQRPNPEVVQHHREYRNRSKSVDVFAVNKSVDGGNAHPTRLSKKTTEKFTARGFFHLIFGERFTVVRWLQFSDIAH